MQGGPRSRRPEPGPGCVRGAGGCGLLTCSFCARTHTSVVWRLWHRPPRVHTDSRLPLDRPDRAPCPKRRGPNSLRTESREKVLVACSPAKESIVYIG